MVEKGFIGDWIFLVRNSFIGYENPWLVNDEAVC